MNGEKSSAPRARVAPTGAPHRAQPREYGGGVGRQDPREWGYLSTPVQKSFVWSLALSVLPVLSAFVVSWVVARWAGVTVWGTVSWAMAFATAALIFGKFGLDLGASRLASEYGVNRPGQLRRLLGTALLLRLGFTLAVAVPTFALARHIADWFNDETLVWPVRAAAAVIVCASVYEFKEQYLIGLNRHATVSKVRAVYLALRVVFTAALVVAGFGATEILFGYTAAWLVGIASFLFLSFRFLPAVGGEADPRPLTRRLMQLSIPLAVSSASVTVYSQMDKLMLGYFDGVAEVGQYAVARQVTEVSLFPAFALVMTLRPVLAARFSSGHREECARLIQHSLRLSLAFGVLFASVFAVLAVPLMTFVYSSEFGYAGELMSVFIWVLALRSVGVLVLPALVAAERTRTYAYLTTISAVINFVLNLLLIPSLHATGAVVATIVSYGILLVLGLVEVFRLFGVRPGARGLGVAIRTILAGTAAATLCWLIFGRTAGAAPPTGWVFVWAALQAVLYAGLLIILRVVNKEDFRGTFGNSNVLKD